MSKTTCPVFRPTIEQFRNFSKYIEKIDDEIGEAGICKVIPPEGWYKIPSAAEIDEICDEKNLIIPPIKQCISGLRGVYQLGLVDTKKMTVKEFQRMADKVQPDKFDDMNYEDRERLFWRSMGPLAPPPLYGADMMGSLFKDNASGWNLNNLDNMIKILPSNLPGITTAMLYFGMWRAMFAFHTEDMNLYSINYLHSGRPKSWYSIPPHAAKRFESMAQSLYPQGFQGCGQYIRHKTTIFSPKVLKDYGIPFHMVVQQPGEFVITFPESYHAGFNHGFNVAEATNFTTERWIAKGKEARVCRCQPYSVHIDMNHFVMKLAEKREHDKAKIELLKTERERKRETKKMDHCGWLEWQKKEQAEARVAEARYQEERMRLMKERKAQRDRERRLKAREEYNVGLGGKRRMDYMSEEDTSVEERLDDEEWEFKCYCGVRCSSHDPIETWPRGAMFQCTGCAIWCHTQCLYNRDKAPMLAFCDVCYERLKSLSEGSLPLRTGKHIKLKSRVAVCRGPRGLEEGVVTMFGEGMARVHFRNKKGFPQHQQTVPEEWIPVMSDRFLSLPQILKALGLLDFSEGDAQAQLIAAQVRKKPKTIRKPMPMRGVPLPTPEAAVAHAKFMKDLHRSKKAFRGFFARSQQREAAPGGYYRRYHAPNAGFEEDWTSDEEEEYYEDGEEEYDEDGEKEEEKEKKVEAKSTEAAGSTAEAASVEEGYKETMVKMAEVQQKAWEGHRKMVESMGLSVNPTMMMIGGGGSAGPSPEIRPLAMNGTGKQLQPMILPPPAAPQVLYPHPYAAPMIGGGFGHTPYPPTMGPYPYYPTPMPMHYPNMMLRPQYMYPYPFWRPPPPMLHPTTIMPHPSSSSSSTPHFDNHAQQEDDLSVLSSRTLKRIKKRLPKDVLEGSVDGWKYRQPVMGARLEMRDAEVEEDMMRMKGKHPADMRRQGEGGGAVTGGSSSSNNNCYYMPMQQHPYMSMMR